MFIFWWLAEWSEQWKSTYIQLLKIGWVILAKLTKMQKRPPKSSKNEMLIFGLCSTSDDRPSNLSNKSWQKCTTEVPQNDLEWPISPNSLFQSFPPEWLRISHNSQFCPICNFSNLFPPKWLRMTWNGQFCMAKKKKNTMIQGNFYGKLHFYMDSCAISPMASLFMFLLAISLWYL